MAEAHKTPRIINTIAQLNSGKSQGSSILGHTGPHAAAAPKYESIVQGPQAEDRAFAEAARDIKAFAQRTSR